MVRLMYKEETAEFALSLPCDDTERRLAKKRVSPGMKSLGTLILDSQPPEL